MATFVEVADLNSGNYYIEIALQRSLFLPTKNYKTCLNFDLVVEYISRSKNAKDGEGMYEVLSVFPLSLDDLQTDHEKVIEVEFDKNIVLDDMVNGLADRFYVCSLVNKDVSDNIIHPHAVHEVHSNSLRLEFDFSHSSIPTSSRCYYLLCSTKDTKGTELIRKMQEETSYCFETDYHHEHDPLTRCNPLA